MKMINVKVEVSGFDDWGNLIKPYVRNIPSSIELTPEIKIGYNHLENINTRQVETIIELLETYTSHFNCDNCHDWGCNQCCNSADEIRARQGIFS